jgi:hypothetical protein
MSSESTGFFDRTSALSLPKSGSAKDSIVFRASSTELLAMLNLRQRAFNLVDRDFQRFDGFRFRQCQRQNALIEARMDFVRVD